MSKNNRSQLDNATAVERVRQLIANGKHKVALESAKDIHKTQHSVESESLLVDAYVGRIQSLLDQKLIVEAKSMLDMVRERYPSAGARLDTITARSAARSGALDELLKPLLDPALTTERRAAIEQTIQREVFDLEALARALPPEHPLAQAASALQQAFQAVTTKAVSDEEIALPGISHRSPLAPWKLLVRAIATYYRGENETCCQLLQTIKPDSVPARLVPALEAMLDGKPSSKLSPSAGVLVAQVSGNVTQLRGSFEALDLVFEDESDARILKAVRQAVQECKQSAPALLGKVRQHISIRCMMAGLDKSEVMSALGGASPKNAYFHRLFARAFECAGNVDDFTIACGAWDEFKDAAIREGWFPSDGIEVATLYLHMAGLLKQIPAYLLRDLQRSQGRKIPVDEIYFLHPEVLFKRACMLDPHSEAFSQWLDWAAVASKAMGEASAEAWHKALPQDIQPVLFLMNATEKRKALQKSIRYLEEAEEIDGVHPEVRRARLRLSAASVQNQIQKKNGKLSGQKLAEMAALPQSQLGDRPAYLAALRYMVSSIQDDADQAAMHRLEITRLLGSGVAASLLIHGVAEVCRRTPIDRLGPVEKIPPGELALLPAAVARIEALAADMEMKLDIPRTWIAATWKQFTLNSKTLDGGQILTLGKLAVRTDHAEFAYAASAAGLALGGRSEAAFLLMRAQSLVRLDPMRSGVCAAATAELARESRDLDLLQAAVGLISESPRFHDLKLKREQVMEILQAEKAEEFFPKSGNNGPDYRRLLPQTQCQCADCRRRRGEFVDPSEDFDPFDDDEDDEDDPFLDMDDDMFDPKGLPPELPPEIAKTLFIEIGKAVARGESEEQFLNRIFGQYANTGRGSSRKGKRK